MGAFDWAKYVDAIYALHYEPYKNRISKFEEQLDKVNILHSPIFKYWISKEDLTLFDKIDQMQPKHPDFYNDRRKIAVNVTFNYYRIFQEVLEKGYEHVLTIEDDVVFLNKDLLFETVQNLPDTWDYVSFDRMFSYPYEEKLLTCEPYNKWLYQNYTGGYWGTVFVMWSKEAVKTALSILDDDFVPSDYILINNDDPRLDHLKRFTPTRFLVCQKGQGPSCFPIFF